MNQPRADFKEKTEALVKLIPRGRVMTYGQIATLLGMPRAAQAVGWTAHYGDAEVPWQRVVNRHGRVAPGWPGGMAAHASVLQSEGVPVDEEWQVDLPAHQWFPNATTARKAGLSEETLTELQMRFPYSPCH